MKRLKSTAGIFAALFVVGGAASASALAAPQYFINKVSFNGEETVEMKVKAGTDMGLNGKLNGGATIAILCAKVKLNNGKIRESFKDSAKAINFEECKVDAPASCSVAKTLITNEVTSEAVDTGTTGVSVIFRPKIGSTFITINVSGELCAGEGAYTVTGSTECEEVNPTAEEVNKGCNFTKTSGSSLAFGTNSAEFFAETEFSLIGANKGKVWFTKH